MSKSNSSSESQTSSLWRMLLRYSGSQQQLLIFFRKYCGCSLKFSKKNQKKPSRRLLSRFIRRTIVAMIHVTLMIVIQLLMMKMTKRQRLTERVAEIAQNRGNLWKTKNQRTMTKWGLVLQMMMQNREEAQMMITVRMNMIVSSSWQ